MKLVYIAGKLNADAVGYLKNVHAMCKVAEECRRAGFAVVVPCLDFVMGIVFGDYEYEDYYNNNQEILDRCDAVLVCPNWETSEGTKKEILRAESRGIPVFSSLDELKKYKRGRDAEAQAIVSLFKKLGCTFIDEKTQADKKNKRVR
jgi:nucleoside 2-deoxyribosyltransferase